MALQNREELKEYVLRKLGKPVVEVNIADEQLEDAITDSVDYFISNHYAGVEESFLKQYVSYKDIMNNSVAIPNEFRAITEVFDPSSSDDTLNNSGVAAWDSLEYQFQDFYNDQFSGPNSFDMTSYYLMKEHWSTMKYLFNIRKQFTHSKISNKFIPLGWNLSDVPRFELLKDRTDLSTDNWTKLFSSVEPDTIPLPNGTLSADKIVSLDTGNAFGVEQDIDLMYYQQGEFTVRLDLKAEEYNSSVIVTVEDEDDVLLTSSTILLSSYYNTSYLKFKMKNKNKSNIKITVKSSVQASVTGDGFALTNISLWKNPYIVLKGYKSIDTDNDIDIWNDSFIKKYAVALAGITYGVNLSKYNGVTLPGGITLDGQTILQRYQDEKDKIEESFSENYELPLDPIIA